MWIVLSDISYLLDSLYKRGASFTKTYSLIKDRELRIISEHLASKKRHFAGHLSEHIEPELSIDLGIRSVEHLNRLEDLDTLQLERVIHKMVKNNTWLCPTLIIYYNKWALSVNDLRQPDLDVTIHPRLKVEWERSLQNNSRAFNEIDFIKRLELVKHLHNSGIPLLAGSDFAGMPFVYPGQGLHQELMWLQKGGLTPAEVLSTCTINPARYWGITDLGLIKPGYQAEFVILKRNPLDDISNLSSIRQVYRKGQLIVDLDIRNR